MANQLNPYFESLATYGRPNLSFGGGSMPNGNMSPNTQPVSFGGNFPAIPTTAGGLNTYGQASVGNVQPSTLTPGTNTDPKGSFLGLTNADGNLDWGNIGQIANVAGGIGKVWAALQTNKIAKESLAFEKSSYNTNLANQLASYNMALSDRAYSRTAQNNGTQADAQAYISQNKLG